jgi:hypothetical protein
VSSDGWQLLFIDLLFLTVAGCLGLWFRAWLRGAREALDTRLDALEFQQSELERVCGQLQTTCSAIETRMRTQAKATGKGSRVRREARPRSTRWSERSEGDDNYKKAQELLIKGVQPTEIARKLGMGVAEVEVIGRIIEQRTNDPLAAADSSRSRSKDTR